MDAKEVYKPSEIERKQAVDGGVRYIAGVSFLHNPEGTREFHYANPDSDKGQQVIVDRAARLIRAGITQIIRYANRPEVRSSLQKMGEYHDDALPHILIIKSELYEGGRAERFFPLIAALEPMAIRNCGIYKRFCHGHFDHEKLPLVQMMDDVSMDERLKDSAKPDR